MAVFWTTGDRNYGVKRNSCKKTKVEVEQEFNQLTESVERMQNLDSSKSDLIEQMREGEVRAAVSEITVEVISKKVAELNLEISRALSGLSEKMTQEVQLLGSLKEAVAIESKEIQRFSDDVIQKLLEIQWWDWDLSTLKRNLSLLRSPDIEPLWQKFIHKAL